MTSRLIFQVLLLVLYGTPARSDSRSPSAALQAIPDFVYLEEEGALVPGRENRRNALYLSDDGLTQSSEIVDNELALFAEGNINMEEIFAALSPLVSGDRFGIQKRSDSISVVDGLYPPYQRVFYRAGSKQAQLYGGLISATPAALAQFARKLHAFCPAPVNQPNRTATRFLQASLLDNETAAEFRRNRALRVVLATELESAPLTAAAVRRPFLLIPIPDNDNTTDTFLTQITGRQPVLDLEYAGVALQLACFKSRKPPP